MALPKRWDPPPEITITMHHSVSLPGRNINLYSAWLELKLKLLIQMSTKKIVHQVRKLKPNHSLRLHYSRPVGNLPGPNRNGS